MEDMFEIKADPELRTIQLACADILKKFRDVCERNGFRYYLAYGTLLGSIRHQGYIPWDDDVDVWMPRPDFEEFLKIAEKEMDPFVVNYYSIENDAGFKYRTQLCIEDHNYKVGFLMGDGLKQGYIWIDVMAMDGMPDSCIGRKLQCKKFRFWYIIIGFARSSIMGASNKTAKHGIKRIGIELNERLNIGKLLNIRKCFDGFVRTKKKYSFESSSYVHGTSSFYTDKAVFPKEWFAGDRKGVFEGEEFSIPCCSEEILTSIYGDYLQLPPEDKRHSKHFVLIDD